MDYTNELVAQAIHKADHQELPWHGQSLVHKERYREYARNAISLLGDDIGVLVLALEDATAGTRIERQEAAA
jgi:hypothetical protein